MMQIKAAAMIRMMVLTMAVAVSVAGIGEAQASSSSSRSSSTSSSRSSSSSFKSGFSSQKSSSSSGSSVSSSKSSSYGFGNSAKSSDGADSGSSSSKKTGFGSFSKSSDAGSAPSSDSATPRSKSALSKDLDQNAANANALKTLDARNAAKESRDNPRYAQQSAAGGPLYPPGGVQQAPAGGQPIIIQNNGGGSSNGWMWFLLGQSMHSHDRERVIIDRGNSSSGNDDISMRPAGTAGSQGTGVTEATGNAPEHPGFFMHLVRILFWLAVLGAVGGGIYYLAKRKGISKSANYTLGKF
ncbi:hypothetical protein ACO0LO_07230 [Undibacterium sp. TJN25]|uniref:hypothetical protein n=1 Tax=Undibacterium sp. TJN25 TaxID=3413056 RepID=UPI003BF33B10